jgi:hypothetical protein
MDLIRIIKQPFIIPCLLMASLGMVLFLPATANPQTSQVNPDISAEALAGYEYSMFTEYKDQGDYKNAIFHLHEYSEIKDSIIKIQRDAKLEEIRTRHDIDTQKHEMNYLIQDNRLKDIKLSRNRITIICVSGLALLFIMIVTLEYRIKKYKLNNQAFALEQTLLRSQMNPHFVFNTLTNIQSFVNRRQTDLSLQYLDHFSDLIGTVLDISGKKAITLETELSVLSNYLKLQKLRFGEKLSYSLNIDPALDPGTVTLPPMLIQPLIENAIEHGIKPKAGQGNVTVSFVRKGRKLVIEVENDGIGRNIPVTKVENDTSLHAGLALVILQERLDAMNNGKSMKNYFEIQDLFEENKNPSGTLVRVVLDSRDHVIKL